LLKIPPTQFR